MNAGCECHAKECSEHVIYLAARMQHGTERSRESASQNEFRCECSNTGFLAEWKVVLGFGVSTQCRHCVL
ncbi:hypothetical protein KC19_8G047900 [Ceratodon purpureus]|uniref:Uncharacterized protein n=1 Tax=Ceratodon purpureus TaxID=3225 RepID=A0A8T0H3H4_CERPU|nr:hypothetical protein KC19_8G047900 [Ceratodon purpureus]